MSPLALPFSTAAGPLIVTALPWLIALAAVVAASLACARMTRRVREAETRLQDAEQNVRLALSQAERDQRRLAEVLHDGPVQDLLAFDLEARVASHLGRSAEAPDIAAVVQQLRAVSEALRPPALGPFGLAAALTAHVDRFRESHPGIAVSLDLDEDRLPPKTRLALFRIAHEAIDNAALHGPPIRIHVHLSTSAAGAELTIRDDGQGWKVPDDISTLARGERYGVFGMLMQAESVGGTLAVQSVPGETVVHATAPSVLPNWA